MKNINIKDKKLVWMIVIWAILVIIMIVVFLNKIGIDSNYIKRNKAALKQYEIKNYAFKMTGDECIKQSEFENFSKYHTFVKLFDNNAYLREYFENYDVWMEEFLDEDYKIDITRIYSDSFFENNNIIICFTEDGRVDLDNIEESASSIKISANVKNYTSTGLPTRKEGTIKVIKVDKKIEKVSGNLYSKNRYLTLNSVVRLILYILIVTALMIFLYAGRDSLKDIKKLKQNAKLILVCILAIVIILLAFESTKQALGKVGGGQFNLVLWSE